MTQGQTMRMARERKKLSQKALSELAGVGQSQISKYESDQMSPNVNTAWDICDVLGITIDEYIGRGRE